ncbi:lipopolysaccharide heptosyltransferase family protein [bacterium]|nr:MAG: lipopolysaccharide heptosyltransferase family protein [bacterium]
MVGWPVTSRSSQSARVLLVRMDGIGDALAVLPLALALRDAGCEVGAVLSPRNQDLFARGLFARVHVLVPDAVRPHGSTEASFEQVRREIPGSYDVALICSEEPDAYRLPAIAGIRTRIGFWNAFEKPFKSLWARWRCTRVVYRPAAWVEQPHEVRQLFALGVKAGLVRGEPPHDLTASREALSVDHVSRVDVVAVQATHKLIPPGRDATWMGRALSAIPKARLLAHTGELALGRQLAAASGHPCDPLGAKGQWLRAVAAAGVLITPDSGAAHVAGAVGTPVADIFPRQHGERLAKQWHPWNAPYRVVLEPAEDESAEAYGARLAQAAAVLIGTA